MDAAVKTASKGKTDVKKSQKIRKVGIIGAGQMGNGIAHVISLAGYDVALNDLKKEAVERAIGTIGKNMSRQVGKGSSTTPK